MINTDDLKKATCHVLAKTGPGTGIFVGNGEVLTCRHVVKGLNKSDEVAMKIGMGETFLGNIKAICEKTDLALIVTKEYANSHSVSLLDCEVLVGSEWACHGHPDTHQGRTVGEVMRGHVIDSIEDSSITTHDLNLSVKKIKLEPEFKGYSGSGAINNQGKVISILRFKNENYLSGVSVRKAASFLRSNGIYVADDELDDFKSMIPAAFSSLEIDIRPLCLKLGDKVADVASPQSILAALQGTTFYPRQNKELKELITMLVKDSGLNKSLWLGWLRFLTYIKLMYGKFEDYNQISVSLGPVEFSRMMDIEISPVSLNMNITFKFFFTKDKSFIEIVTEYLYDKLPDEEIKAGVCYVFNSPHDNFGIRPFTAEQKRKIVLDIANGNGGLQVPGRLDFGILSIDQLSRAVANSHDWASATQNLKNLLKDVLI